MSAARERLAGGCVAVAAPAVSQCPSLTLETFVLLWQEPCPSQRWITSGDCCLKSGTAHCFAAASHRGATIPPVSDPTEMCVSANHFTAIPILCPGLPFLVVFNVGE